MNRAFFDAVRAAPFRGRLTQGQVDGLTKITDFAKDRGTSIEDLAYILATVFHETAEWMQPIREGARRYGKKYTDAQSRRAVKAIFDKGIIRWNYALPDTAGNSFYGRGLVQITHKENYLQFEDITGAPLASQPDLALEWDHALLILFVGMEDGMFRRGHDLGSVDQQNTYADWIKARGIINGDVRKNGKLCADLAQHFYTALEGNYGNDDCTCVC